MNQNVTASFGLSVLIVLFFAVALYQPDPPPSPNAPATTAATSEVPTTKEAPTPPVTRAEEARVEPPEPPVRPTVATRPVPTAARPRPTIARAEAVKRPKLEKRDAPGVVKRTAGPSVARRRREPFTECRPGESLADVAARVYGSTESTQTLWLANRDVLDRADAPLRTGTLLRTP